MARAKDYDPLIYRARRQNLSRAKNKGEKEHLKYLRGCGSNFIKRVEVREFILSKGNHKCADCDSIEALEIDHITSVYEGWRKGIDVEIINSLDNLQVLCSSCNASKLP